MVKGLLKNPPIFLLTLPLEWIIFERFLGAGVAEVLLFVILDEFNKLEEFEVLIGEVNDK